MFTCHVEHVSMLALAPHSGTIHYYWKWLTQKYYDNMTSLCFCRVQTKYEHIVDDELVNLVLQQCQKHPLPAM